MATPLTFANTGCHVSLEPIFALTLVRAVFIMTLLDGGVANFGSLHALVDVVTFLSVPAITLFTGAIVAAKCIVAVCVRMTWRSRVRAFVNLKK